MIKFRINQEQRWIVPAAILAAAGLAALMLFRLGSLAGGLSGSEQQVAATAYGWHGLWHQPLYLPLNFVRSVIFFSFTHHGQTLTRLPNVLFGALTITALAALLRFWYGGRTALLTAILFACGAWTLHASRLASYDVLYLLALPTVLLAQQALQKWSNCWLVYYGSLLVWLLLLFVPGTVWFVVLGIFWSRRAWWRAWAAFGAWWQRVLYILLTLPFLALLGHTLSLSGSLKSWLGLPDHLASPLQLLHQAGAVPYHLFIRGPLYPDLWLGRAPILDIFTLVVTAVGLYFYAQHWQAGRSRQLAALFLAGWAVVALNGPVGLSLLIPLLYLCAAAGIAYLLREWLVVFPLNPLARGVSIGLVSLLVAISCIYNLRAYFVAWAHDPATRTEFRYRR